jgi:hypothetical protein
VGGKRYVALAGGSKIFVAVGDVDLGVMV